MLERMVLSIKILVLCNRVKLYRKKEELLSSLFGPRKLNIDRVTSDWFFDNVGIEGVDDIRYRHVEGWVGRKRLKWISPKRKIVKGVQMRDEEAYPIIGSFETVKKIYEIIHKSGLPVKHYNKDN